MFASLFESKQISKLSDRDTFVPVILYFYKGINYEEF